MIRWFSLSMLGWLVAAWSIEAAEPPAPQWIVVTAPAFRSAVEPLCQHRRGQGMKVIVVQTTDLLSDQEVRKAEARKLQDHVRHLCRASQGVSFVLLVGAVTGTDLVEPEKKVVPPTLGTIGRMKGQPTDSGYGRLTEEVLPGPARPGEGPGGRTIAVGRLPARTEAEARAMMRKTLEYEQDTKPGPWRQQITVLAGAPEFNPLVDGLVEQLAVARLERLSPRWTGRAIYHNSQSRFHVPDPHLRERALEFVQQGQAITLYLGHSSAEGFHGGLAPYLDRKDWGKLAIAQGPGIFATFGCLGCQLAGMDGEGYGVAAIRNPRGPVAVIGSHGICFAAMVQLACDGLTESIAGAKPPERLAEPWLRLLTSLGRGEINPLTFRLLDAVDGDSRIPQATQRLEHIEMFVLLGDPALRLPAIPFDIRLKGPNLLRPGQPVSIEGELPARLQGARLLVTLERPITSEPGDLEPVPEKPAAARARAQLANHQRANRFGLLQQEVQAVGNRFEARFEAPARLPWPQLIVRAHGVNGQQEGLGTLIVPVKRD